MAIADKIIALLDTMTIASLNELVPARRRQFAELCRHWAKVADRPKAPPPKSGVLADLKEGRREN